MQDTGSGYDLIRNVAAREAEKLHLPEYGVVESVDIHESDSDGVGYTCSVQLPARGGIKLSKVPIATSFMGMINVPKIGDCVLICYINGDFELPVIIGSLYSKERTPPLYEDGQILWEISKSDFSSSPETAKLDIKFVDGNELTINMTDSSLKIDVGGSLKVAIDYKDDKAITLDASGCKLVLEESGNVKLEADGDIDLKASGSINIEASSTMTLKASKIDLNP